MKVTYGELLKRKQNYDANSVARTNSEITKFAQMMQKDIAKADKVLILGDYDADGILSSTILSRVVSTFCDKEPDVVIGDRYKDGYGIGSLEDLPLEKGTLVICTDIGSTEREKIEEIFKITKVAPYIIDHHEIADDMDGYMKMLNFTGMENAPDYCATGLAERIYQGLYRTLAIENREKLDALVEMGLESEYRSVQAFACIGTIADMVSVNNPYDANREIIKNGFEAIKQRNVPLEDGLTRFLKDCCEVYNKKELTTEMFQFSVAPLINAWGRMEEGGAQKVFDALNSEDSLERISKLNELTKQNEKRKDTVNEFINGSRYQAFLSETQSKKCNVYFDADIPKGISGLIATELVKATGKPSIVFSLDKEKNLWTASGRNAEGYPSMFDVLKDFDYYESFGGHEGALGLSVSLLHQDDKLSNLENFILYAHKVYEDIQPQIVEGETLKDVSKMTVDKLLALEPFGVDFPKVAVEEEVTVANVKTLSGGYSSFYDKDGMKYFGKDLDVSVGDKIKVSGTLSYNEYFKNQSLQINVNDFVQKDKSKETSESKELEEVER